MSAGGESAAAALSHATAHTDESVSVDPHWIAALVGGGAACGFALRGIYRSKAFASRAARASGIIVGAEPVRRISSSRRRPVYAPVVRFADSSGREVEFTSDVAGSGIESRVGAAVTVVYDPDNPENARLDGAVSLYAGPAALLVIGLGFALLGAIGIGLLDVLGPGRYGPLEGRWINEDARSSGVVRIELRSKWPSLSLRTWKRCAGGECEWGSLHSWNDADAKSGAMWVRWRDGRAYRDQQWTLLPDGRLRVVTQIHSLGRETTDYFRK